MAKVLNVTFERPDWLTRHSVFGPDWEFTAETDEDLPHGYPVFSGYVKQLPTSYWKAKSYLSPYCSPARTRLEAIQNCLPEAIRQFRQLKDEKKEQKRQAALDELAEVRKLIPTNTKLSIGVVLNDYDSSEYQIRINKLTRTHALCQSFFDE